LPFWRRPCRDVDWGDAGGVSGVGFSAASVTQVVRES